MIITVWIKQNQFFPIRFFGCYCEMDDIEIKIYKSKTLELQAEYTWKFLAKLEVTNG